MRRSLISESNRVKALPYAMRWPRLAGIRRDFSLRLALLYGDGRVEPYRENLLMHAWSPVRSA